MQSDKVVIKPTKEQLGFIKELSAVVNYDGCRYAHIPYFFKANGDGTIELLNFNDIPEKVQKQLEHLSPLLKVL